MVRLTDLTDAMRETVTRINAEPVDPPPWVPAPPAGERNVALISSAGLGLRTSPPFRGGDGGYREIPQDVPASDVVMSHLSVNYDRTAFQLSLDSIFPRQRLTELAEEGVIGAPAQMHYSFMGASSPEQLNDEARSLAATLKERGTNVALLLPV